MRGKIISGNLFGMMLLCILAIHSCTDSDNMDHINAEIIVDPETESKSYSPMIFGGFLEHFHDQIYGGVFDPGSPLSTEQGFRKDVIAAMKELNLPIVRWPGGCFASGYHWEDGVGKVRDPVADPVWGVTDPNTFGTNEFVQWCRLVGCEPYICVNAGNGTPEEMKEWVEYCNSTEGEFAEMRKASGVEEPLNVKYWAIGNENMSAVEIGQKTTEEWGPFVKKSADLMLEADPDIKMSAAATPNIDGWIEGILEHAGEKIEYVTTHKYMFSFQKKNAMPDYLTCIMRSEVPEYRIREMIDIIDNAGYKGKIKIAFDEWNVRGWHHPGFPRKEVIKSDDVEAIEQINKREINSLPEQYTVADALISASLLNSCLRHCEDIGMANMSPIINTRGALYVHPEGIVKRTTFHTLAMYSNLLEDRVVPIQFRSDSISKDEKSVPVIDAIVTSDKSGRNWSLAIVNRHPDSIKSCSIKISGKLLDGNFDATILSGNSPEDYNEIENPERVIPEQKIIRIQKGIIHLPPHSLLILKVT